MAYASTKKGVEWVRPELEAVLPQYQLIADCIAGEQAVKSKTTEYLPDPSGLNCEAGEKVKRYKDYLARAQYFNFSRRTQQGLCGYVFSKAPTVELEEKLKPIEKSASGDGVSLQQQAKNALELLISFSRFGLLVDFPDTGGKETSAEESEVIRPTLTLYRPEDVTNWHKQDVGADEVLTLVVLREKQEMQSVYDSFALAIETWYRVYKLTNAGVICEIWKPKGSGTQTLHKSLYSGVSPSGGYQLAKTAQILESNQQPAKRIPFLFAGLKSNRCDVEEPAFYDIASLNISHYRTSADYEEMLHAQGQPTLVASGLTKTWYDEILKGTVQVGVRGFLPLPEGGDSKYLQLEDSPLLSEALQRKEQQAVALGVKLVEQKQVQRTATEAKIESTAEGSVLQNAAQNVSSVYRKALEIAARFTGSTVTEENLKFQLNSEFDLTQLSSDQIAQVVQGVTTKMLAWSEGRKVMKAVGYASLTDEEAKAEIEKDEKKEMETAAKSAELLTKATAEPDDDDAE